MSKLLENTALVSFGFEGHEVRLVERDGISWWVAADVCDVLEHTNPTMAVSRLDEDEKMTLNISEGRLGKRGGAQFVNVINESGLYSLILTSRKPEARRFKKWLTSEVLPAIRRTGRYESRKEEAAPALPPPPPAFTPEIMQSMMQGAVQTAMQSVQAMMEGILPQIQVLAQSAVQATLQNKEEKPENLKPRKYDPDSRAAHACRENGKKGGRPRSRSGSGSGPHTPKRPVLHLPRTRPAMPDVPPEAPPRVTPEQNRLLRKELGLAGDAYEPPAPERPGHGKYYTMAEAAQKLGLSLRDFTFILHAPAFSWLRISGREGAGLPRKQTIDLGYMVSEEDGFFITVKGLVYLERRLSFLRADGERKN